VTADAAVASMMNKLFSGRTALLRPLDDRRGDRSVCLTGGELVFKFSFPASVVILVARSSNPSSSLVFKLTHHA
jgi:hypothetical protein|tara:strand:- start:470 stop:691 length:222 start_codon:yes stop_codon:yes gene_type:complete